MWVILAAICRAMWQVMWWFTERVIITDPGVADIIIRVPALGVSA